MYIRVEKNLSALLILNVRSRLWALQSHSCTTPRVTDVGVRRDKAAFPSG